LRVAAWSRSLTPLGAEALGVDFLASPGEGAEKCDIVSVHLALTPETRGIIDADFFRKMREGACFINTSRSEIVDQKALLDAVRNKKIRAGLDVFDDEPADKSGPYSGELKDVPGIYVTHHIGASTSQAQKAVADEVITILETYIRSGQVKNCVNLLDKTPAKYVLSVRHRNRVGVLSDVLRIIREAEINVESMENIIFNGTKGACANIQIDDCLPDDKLTRIQKDSPDIHSVTLTPIT
jgi:D-3-phosphoglycerate dehydrogenase